MISMQRVKDSHGILLCAVIKKKVPVQHRSGFKKEQDDNWHSENTAGRTLEERKQERLKL